MNNKFDNHFFGKYAIYPWEKVLWVLRTHGLTIFNKVVLNIILFAIIPILIYFNVKIVNDFVSFSGLEFYLFAVFLKILIDIFIRYYTVFVITNFWMIRLTVKSLKLEKFYITYERIEYLEILENGIFNKSLKTWDLVAHLFPDDSLLKKDEPDEVVLKKLPKPFLASELIENAFNEVVIKDDDIDENYDVIMNTLWGAVQNYLHRNKRRPIPHMNNIPEEEQEEEILSEEEIIIRDTESKDWTIDLR